MKARNSSPKSKPPVLEKSPFDPAELVDEHDLSEPDRKFLNEREATIAAGRRTFLEVGQALLEIKNYQNGRLYKRYGTFEAYCQERWEFGRSYASRIMAATEVYLEMLPRGNKIGEDPGVLPTTEKQLRSLTKLPAALRLQAWGDAVEVAGDGPVLSRYVDKEVKKLTAKENLPPTVQPRRRKPPQPVVHHIAASDLKKIHAELASIKRWSANGKHAVKIQEALQRLADLLPSRE